MFCNECGAKNPDTAKFCSECGTKFIQKMTTEAKAADSNNKEDFFEMFEEVVPETAKGKKVAQPITIKEETSIEKKEKKKESIEVPTTEEKKEIPETLSEKNKLKATDKETSIEERLASLSTASIIKQNKPAQSNVNPATDPYWDDVVPEIDNEIYAIPKDNIIKVLASVAALFIVITYLIFML